MWVAHRGPTWRSVGGSNAGSQPDLRAILRTALLFISVSYDATGDLEAADTHAAGKEWAHGGWPNFVLPLLDPAPCL